MRHFFAFARHVVHDRGLLVMALIAALISAANLGAGILALKPTFAMMVTGDDKPGSLRELAIDFNARETEQGLINIDAGIPQGIIDVLPTTQMQSIIWMVVTICGLTLFGAICNFTHQYLSVKVAVRSIANARNALFRRAIHAPLSRITGRGASEFVSRIIRDTAELQRGLIAVMSKAVSHSTQAVVLFVIALILGQMMTLAALVAVPAAGRLPTQDRETYSTWRRRCT